MYVNQHVCKQDVRNDNWGDNWGVCECPHLWANSLNHTRPVISSCPRLAWRRFSEWGSNPLQGWWRASKFKWLECEPTFKWLESETNHILILPAAHGSLYQYVQTYTCTQICIFFCRSLRPGKFTWLAREKHTFSIASSKIPNVSECYLATNGKRHENTNGLSFFPIWMCRSNEGNHRCPHSKHAIMITYDMYIFYFQTHLYHIVA